MNLPGTPLKPSPTWWHGLATLSGNEADAADATAWSLVALLVFCTVCFLGGALVLRRREHHISPEQEARAPQGHVQRPESSASQKSESSTEEDPKRQPWERGADWWKDQE